jgi:DNA-binding HxlR family transcriptional regulator
MSSMENQHGYCPYFQHAMELLGRRWTGSIVHAMFTARSQRFCDIKAGVPGLSDRLLTERLEELVAEGVLSRSGSRPHVTYQLTAKGEALRAPFTILEGWAAEWCCDTPPSLHPGRIRANLTSP